MPERKALLLPLGDAGLMRGAARRVTSLKLTQRATQKYVTSLLAERGDARAVWVTAQVCQFRERVTGKAFEQHEAGREVPGVPHGRGALRAREKSQQADGRLGAASQKF